MRCSTFAQRRIDTKAITVAKTTEVQRRLELHRALPSADDEFFVIDEQKQFSFHLGLTLLGFGRCGLLADPSELGRLRKKFEQEGFTESEIGLVMPFGPETSTEGTEDLESECTPCPSSRSSYLAVGRFDYQDGVFHFIDFLQ